MRAGTGTGCGRYVLGTPRVSYGELRLDGAGLSSYRLTGRTGMAAPVETPGLVVKEEMVEVEEMLEEAKPTVVTAPRLPKLHFPCQNRS